MKKTHWMILGNVLLLLSASLFFSNCSKDRIEENEKSLNEYESINSYFDVKKQEEQEFIIDSTGTGPIIGNQGTKIWTGKQCLMFPNGDSVTWPYTIKLVELYTAKDMIYYQMPTITAGALLKTEGEIRLRAFKDGTELLLRPDPCQHQIEMPSTAPQNGMQVYNGITTNNHPDWVADNPVNLFSATAYGHLANIHQLGWINCGLWAGSNSNATLTFASTTDNLANVGIFIYFPATKTVMQAYDLSSQAIPLGSNAKIVAIGINSSGDLFHYYQSLTVNASAAIEVTMSAISDAALTTLLDNL
jgi:hypothetical protein